LAVLYNPVSLVSNPPHRFFRFTGILFFAHEPTVHYLPRLRN
jgi:hypothetical protein